MDSVKDLYIGSVYAYHYHIKQGNNYKDAVFDRIKSGKNSDTDEEAVKLCLQGLFDEPLHKKPPLKISCPLSRLFIYENYVSIQLHAKKESSNALSPSNYFISVIFPNKLKCSCKEDFSLSFATEHSDECTISKEIFLAAINHVIRCLKQSREKDKEEEITYERRKKIVLRAIEKVKDKIEKNEKITAQNLYKSVLLAQLRRQNCLFC